MQDRASALSRRIALTHHRLQKGVDTMLAARFLGQLLRDDDKLRALKQPTAPSETTPTPSRLPI
jgi:hypothetical protein